MPHTLLRAKLLRFFWAIIWNCAILPIAPGAAATEVKSELKISQIAAKRNGRSHCWAQFNARDTKAEFYLLCIPRKIWREYLTSKKTLCSTGVWSGKRKIWHSKTEGGSIQRNFFQVSELPKGKCNGSVLRRSFKIFERWREDFHFLVKPYDRLGIIRKLVINQSAEGSGHYFLRIMGFVHLISVAGIHLYALFRWFDILKTMLISRLGLRYFWVLYSVRFFMVTIVLTLWLLEGMRAGMLRPIGVVALRRLAIGLGFRWTTYSPLILICLFDLGIECLWFWFGEGVGWSPGRFHYFLAVWGGLFAIAPEWDSKLHLNKRNLFREHFLLSVGSWIPTAYYDVMSTGLLAVFTPVISLLTIPFFSLVVLPLVLMMFWVSVLLKSSFVEETMSTLINISNWIVESIFTFSVKWDSLWVLDPYYLLVGILMFSFLAWLPKKVAAVISLTMTLYFLVRTNLNERDPPQNWAKRVEQLNIGQGDALLVKMSNGAFGMFDVGSIWSYSSQQWFELFIRNRVFEIQWIGLSHLDEDHRGGLNHILKIIHVNEIIASRQLWESARGRRLKSQYATHPARVTTWQKSSYPFRYVHSRPSNKPNGVMTGILIPTQCGNYLNFGDASARDEREMFAQLGEIPPGPRILKISHHGSRYSTSIEFLKELDPNIAWISCGRRNGFGHPSIEVLMRLRSLGIPYRRSFDEESLHFEKCK